MPSFQSSPHTVCILRLSAIGDVTHVLPVLHAMRVQWPEAEITWICGALEYKLLACVPGVRFIVFDKADGWRAYRQVRHELAGKRFDVLLHMQVAARANLLSRLIRADLRIGWDRSAWRDLHGWFIDHSISNSKNRHQVDSFLAFAAALGVETDGPVWDYPIPDAATRFAGQHVDSNRKTLLISPCSSHALRNWVPARYAAVADYAIAEHGMQVILSGGPGKVESRMGQQIEQAMQHTPLNLIGRDTLVQSMAMLQAVDVVIAPDTGPAHMANAVGTKVIGLYACTNPQRSGPYHSRGICIDEYDQAAQRFLGKPATALRWGTKIEQAGVMELITVEQVTAMLDRVLASGSSCNMRASDSPGRIFPRQWPSSDAD